MAKEFYEAIIASGGFAGETYDLSGTLNADIISASLAGADGTLTINAPLSLTLDTDIVASRALTLTPAEQDGRIFFLKATTVGLGGNVLTVTPSSTINGNATLAISTASEYLLVHRTGGAWDAFALATASAAQIYREDLASGLWAAGTGNEITILQTGAAGAGQGGPHALAIAGSYLVQVYSQTDDELKDMGIEVDGTTGNVTLTKTGLAPTDDLHFVMVGD